MSNLTIRVLQACFSCKEFATRTRNIACGNVRQKEGLCFHFAFDCNKVRAIKSTVVIVKTKWHWMNPYSQTKAVFKWLSKNQYQSSYSDQSREEQTARWTSQNSQQLPAPCSKRVKIERTSCDWLCFFLLIGWKTNARFLSQSLNVAIAIAQLISTVIWKQHIG